MRRKSSHPEMNIEGELGIVWEGLGRDGFRKTVETFDPEGIRVLLFWIRGD